MIPCKGGNITSRNGAEAVKALSWAQVQDIVKKFGAVEPLRPQDNSRLYP